MSYLIVRDLKILLPALRADPEDNCARWIHWKKRIAPPWQIGAYDAWDERDVVRSLAADRTPIDQNSTPTNALPDLDDNYR